MKTTFLGTKQIGQQLERLMREFDEFCWAVAWGSQGPHAQRLLDNESEGRYADRLMPPDRSTP